MMTLIGMAVGGFISVILALALRIDPWPLIILICGMIWGGIVVLVGQRLI